MKKTKHFIIIFQENHCFGDKILANVAKGTQKQIFVPLQ
jgi:hypothetical protein